MAKFSVADLPLDFCHLRIDSERLTFPSVWRRYLFSEYLLTCLANEGNYAFAYGRVVDCYSLPTIGSFLRFRASHYSRDRELRQSLVKRCG